VFTNPTYKFVLALVLALGLMTPGTAWAGAPTGTGPSDAMAPTGNYQHLNPGQEHWYVFQTTGQHGSPSQALVTLAAQPNESAQFSIWTDSQLAKRATASNPSKDAPAIGQGTKLTYTSGAATLERYNGALAWTGTFNDPTKLYVQVQPTGMRSTDYLLNISGTALNFPTVGVVTAAAPALSESPAPLVLPVTGPSQAGSSMSLAMVPTGAQMTVKPGQPHWYVINVPGNHDAHPAIVTELRAQPSGAAKFTVWTADRLHARAISSHPDKDGPPVGVSMVQTYKDGTQTLSRYGGNPIWKGDARDAGTYYVVVETTGATPADYQLFTTITP
jgi:hypothetical protein